MDVVNDEDDAMATVMGLNGFGSTKVVHLHFIPLDVHTDDISLNRESKLQVIKTVG